ncbi:AAA family ATPase [Acinetobacter guillouiae]|uniref:AAA+ ATPase domain-containing protein n=1 Tax=Acinetobacter guillouiae NIPH 991 TaxID=1217656 RepID=N8YB07_ACIGI|nr:ATP-binding protein [Acinetobacter guillouiae]ENV18469.1 hypothetical protein F964_00893 [Acinetobacter guillouiae NIPH 991]
MAIPAAQVLALIESHGECNDHRFYAIALQIAAKEARSGHVKIASQISEKVNKYQFSRYPSTNLKKEIDSNEDIRGLIELYLPTHRLSELFLCDETKNRLNLIIKEHKRKDELHKFDLRPRSKLLFEGCPGTGKTLAASVIASELNLPLYKIVLESVISKYMGDTASHLKKIFKYVSENQGVFLFDEFDSIGSERSNINDVGESRRTLNSFLILLEQLQSDSVVIAATNHPQILDEALNRRFDDIIKFKLPSDKEIKDFLENRLSMFKTEHLEWEKIISLSQGLSLGDINKAFDDGAKQAIFDNKGVIVSKHLVNSLERRKYSKAGRGN